MELLPQGAVTVSEKVVSVGARHVILEATYERREVAAKRVLRPDLEDLDRAEDELVREFEVLSRLDHPGIEKAYGLWRHPETRLMHLIVERVRGTSLDQVIRVCQDKRGLRGGARHWDPITQDIVRQVGEALAYMHGRGVIYNDIKPDNLILWLEGRRRVRLKFVDFDSTGPDSVKGRPEYTAPERHAHEPATERSDVYGFAILIYKVLTGTVPYPQDKPGEARKAKETPLNEIKDDRAEAAWRWVSQWKTVAEALLSATKFDPKDRIPDVPAFLQKLGLAPTATGVEPSYGIAALLGLLVGLLAAVPVTDSIMSRWMLDRAAVGACRRAAALEAERACGVLRPDDVAACVADLKYMAWPAAECSLRLRQLRACVPPAAGPAAGGAR